MRFLQQQEKIDAREQKRFEQQRATKHNCDFVMIHNNRIVGYFGFTPHFNHPLFGNYGGINIMLLPEVQKKGLGKAAYKHLLCEMQKIGLDLMYGRTSNPGVIHIGKKIGRRVRRILLRKDGPFLSDALMQNYR